MVNVGCATRASNETAFGPEILARFFRLDDAEKALGRSEIMTPAVKHETANREHRFWRLIRFSRDRAPNPPVEPAPTPKRREALVREYELLRADNRSYPAVMVAMASAGSLVGGTSVFFLLRGCGVESTAGCTSYPGQVYALLPAPSLVITALLVQQAVVAVIRSRLLLAIEVALSTELQEEYRLGSGTMPIHSTFHAQQQLHHEVRGAMLWTIMFALPFILLVGLVYYCGLKLDGIDRWIFYGGYVILVAIIAWSGLSVLRGYQALDSSIYRFVNRRRAEGRFRL